MAVGVCTVLAGPRTFVTIAEWAHDLPAGCGFGFWHRIPRPAAALHEHSSRSIPAPEPPPTRAISSTSNLAAVRDAGIRIGADPLGGARVAYWGVIAERHGLDLTVVNLAGDPQSWGLSRGCRVICSSDA